MHAEPHLKGILAAPTLHRRGAIGLLIVLVLAWVFAVHARTTYSMVAIWERSETFAHGFVIVPIFLYLLWREREALATFEPKPFLPALIVVLAAGAIWLLGTRLLVNSIAQFALIAMIPAVVWMVLGSRALKLLGFPLGFLFFAVPFGEFLIPQLMDWTADVTVFAVRASGVPVYREGNFFMIPTGTWSIVEACSGLRYLIASLVVGCLYAYLSYRSPVKRASFVVLSLVVPIVANWIRAYMIVMLGHLSGNRIAVGADHLLYGWVFFGIVMAILFWVGARWRDDHQPEVAASGSAASRATPSRLGGKVWPALAGAAALTAIFPLLDAQLGHASKTTAIALGPIAGRNGWTAAPEALSSWRPDVANASAEVAQTFAKDGSQVGLFIAFYRNAAPEAKAITSTNQLVRTTNKQWLQVASDTIATQVGDQLWRTRTGVVVRNHERLAVWQWYWVDGRVTASDSVAKLYEMLALLRGHGDPVAWVVVYTPTERSEEGVRATLQAFTADMRGAIDAALRDAGEVR